MIINMTPIRKILHQYVNKGWTSAEEIAGLIGKSKRYVYYVLEGEKHLKDHEILTLTQHFSRMGKNQLARLFLSSGYEITKVGEVTIDGSLNDEAADLMRVMGEIMTLTRQHEIEEALERVDDLKNITNRVKEEVRRVG